VDINPCNLARVVRADVCVNADAGLFFARLLGHADLLRRCPDGRLQALVRKLKGEDARRHRKVYARCGADPLAFVLALRCCTNRHGLVFVDVSLTEHLAAEAFTVFGPRTYFNPSNNQAMGWSIPAGLGAQAVHPGRQVVTITGDGCLLMTAVELSTA